MHLNTQLACRGLGDLWLLWLGLVVTWVGDLGPLQVLQSRLTQWRQEELIRALKEYLGRYVVVVLVVSTDGLMSGLTSSRQETGINPFISCTSSATTSTYNHIVSTAVDKAVGVRPHAWEAGWQSTQPT